jgi:hypothetical protein
MKSTTKTKRLVWSAAAVFVIAIVALCALCFPLISSRLYVTKTMKVLHSTSDLASRSYQGSGTGGFVYQMKGPLPEAEFRTCSESIGLTKYDPEQHGVVSDRQVKDFVTDPLWWNEASGLDHYYFRNSLDDRFVVRAKWEDGQIYFLAIEPGSGTL